MRNAFLALLVVNVVFLLWTGWVDRPRAAVAAALAPDVPMLELTQVPVAPSVTLLHCRSIGPFADAGAASATADLLRAHGLPLHQRNVEGSVPDGYWVYVEDLRDSAARRKVIAALSNAGIRDAAVMPDESERVSVGIFSDQRHAVHRAEQVQELGFKPTMSVHQRTTNTLWIDVDLKPGEGDPAPVQPTPPPAKKDAAAGEAVKVTDCPAKAPSAD